MQLLSTEFQITANKTTHQFLTCMNCSGPALAGSMLGWRGIWMLKVSGREKMATA